MISKPVRGYKPRCDNCGCKATLCCVTCQRDMCDDCWHCGIAGKVCGLCRSREQGYDRWQRLGSPGDFDEWYDKNG